MAENQMNNETSFQRSEMPITCANGCGFYGTPSTLNMCSKCYRDHFREENESASVIAALEESFLPASQPPVASAEVDENDASKLKLKTASCSNSTVTVEEKAVVKPKNRCGSCNKRVGMLGFECKCGITFCGSHRYPEEHECTFDFAGLGKKAIEKANPIIKADKLARF